MTIKDIAKECDCAVGTVSRVLNNHPDVSVQMRTKVQSVVDKYGFELNTNARLLKVQESKTLVVLVKGTSSALLSSLLEKVQKRIEVLKYNTHVVILDEYDNEVQKAIRLCYEQKPVGLIFLGGTPEKYESDFKKITIPCVLISSQVFGNACENLSSVSIDNFEASRFSAEYLIKNGHTKIGVIGGSFEASVLSKVRYDGFLSALKSAGIDFDYETSYDISVIGFDGIPLAEYYCPKLTTVRQLQDELVEYGLDILLNAIERKSKPVHKIVPFEFVQGESVKKIEK